MAERRQICCGTFLLRYINEKLRPEHQVIYTTHSPFMIDPENITAVRTVEDREQDGAVIGTKIGERIFGTDKETILPLQGALGYDITQTLFVGPNTIVVEGPSDLLYLKWFSTQLTSAGRQGLDPRWTISPIGGITKIGSFVALLYGQITNIAVLTDVATGEKAEVQRLRKSELLQDGHVFTAENYAGQSEADTEDILGRENYIELVNACYNLKGKQKVPATKPAGAAMRVAKEVKEHFRTLPPSVREFDHLAPASYLVENGASLINALPDLANALERFERLFADLNSVLES